MEHYKFLQKHPELKLKRGLYKVQPKWLSGKKIYKIGKTENFHTRFGGPGYGMYWPPPPGSQQAFFIHQVLKMPDYDRNYLFTTKAALTKRENELKDRLKERGIRYHPKGYVNPMNEWSTQNIDLKEMQKGNDVLYTCNKNECKIDKPKRVFVQNPKIKPRPGLRSGGLPKKGSLDDVAIPNTPIEYQKRSKR